MGKTITIGDDAYKLLASLKESPRDTFSQVILRNIYKPFETCAKIVSGVDRTPPAKINVELSNRFEKERKRRSGGRK